MILLAITSLILNLIYNKIKLIKIIINITLKKLNIQNKITF